MTRQSKSPERQEVASATKKICGMQASTSAGSEVAGAGMPEIKVVIAGMPEIEIVGARMPEI